MILPLFLAVAAASAGPPSPTGMAARFDACAALARTDPTRAQIEAEAWRERGGGIAARHCQGLALVRQGRWQPATIAFTQAATQAEADRDGRAADLWVQAGNAALAGDDPALARQLLDRALTIPVLSPQMQGEVKLDRARADVALGKLAEARTDLDAALAKVPADPLAWLLSATLARRANDLPRAAKDIAEAVRRAPDDAAVALEQGNVAAAQGSAAEAMAAWGRAAKIGPGTPEGQAAAQAIAANR